MIPLESVVVTTIILVKFGILLATILSFSLSLHLLHALVT